MHAHQIAHDGSEISRSGHRVTKTRPVSVQLTKSLRHEILCLLAGTEQSRQSQKLRVMAVKEPGKCRLALDVAKVERTARGNVPCGAFVVSAAGIHRRSIANHAWRIASSRHPWSMSVVSSLSATFTSRNRGVNTAATIRFTSTAGDPAQTRACSPSMVRGTTHVNSGSR